MFHSHHSCFRHVNCYLNCALPILKQQFRPSQRVASRCSKSRPIGLSFSTLDSNENEHKQCQVRLATVFPPIYEALADPRQKKKGSVLQRNTKGHHINLCTYEDGKRLLSKKWIFPTSKDGRRDRPTPIGFNAINARLHKLGLDLNRRNLLYGMQSMYEHPAALKNYLGLLQSLDTDDSSAIEDLGQFFEYITPRLRKPQQRGFLIRSKHAYDQQWFNVITGLADNESIQNNTLREQSLYDLGPGLSLKYWGQYINAVHRILGPETACLEFRRFKKQNEGRSSRGEDNRNWIKWFLNPTILQLADGGDPRHAWDLVQELQTPSKDLQPRTWKALLAYPDCVRDRIPKIFPWLNLSKLELIREQVMGVSNPEKLELELERLETDMGLVWTGGEDGCHTIAASSSFLPGFKMRSIQ